MKEEKRNIILTLEKAKEWYKKGGELKEVALQAFKEEELSNPKPRSWEEYCKNHYGDYYYITSDSNIVGLGFNPGHCELSPVYAKNVMPTKELAEAFLAMMQLMSLRQAWIGDWKPDWKDDSFKWCIQLQRSEFICTIVVQHVNCPLSFPTMEMSDKFIACFKDLLKKARGLY